MEHRQSLWALPPDAPEHEKFIDQSHAFSARNASVIAEKLRSGVDLELANDPLIAQMRDVQTGETLLHLACAANATTTVEHLLAMKADPLANAGPLLSGVRPRQGPQPLAIAAVNGATACVKMLIDHDAEAVEQMVFNHENFGRDALTAAVKARQIEPLKAMLGALASIDSHGVDLALTRALAHVADGADAINSEKLKECVNLLHDKPGSISRRTSQSLFGLDVETIAQLAMEFRARAVLDCFSEPKKAQLLKDFPDVDFQGSQPSPWKATRASTSPEQDPKTASSARVVEQAIPAQASVAQPLDISHLAERVANARKQMERPSASHISPKPRSPEGT